MKRALGRGIIEVPSSAEAHAALDNLNSRLARLESARLIDKAAPLDAVTRALFVRYGAALLSAPLPPTSAVHWAIHEEQVADLDYAALRLSVNGACEWLQLLKLKPRRVFSLDDFDSQIIGRAMAQQLEAEFEVANGEGFTHSKALIISADSRLLTAPPLRIIFPGQVLYAFNLHRETGAIAPDVSSLASHELTLPWHAERLSARRITGIVERIATAPLRETNGDWLARLEFYRERRMLLAAGNSSFTRLSMLPEFS